MSAKKPYRAPVTSSPCSCATLRKASRRITQLYDAALSPTGIKATQRMVLAQIGRTEPAAVGLVAVALVMDPGALAHTLKLMVRDGLVTFESDCNDRRSKLARLTERGRAKLKESESYWQEAQLAFQSSLGEKEADALRNALRFVVSEEFSQRFDARLSRATRI